MTQLTSAPYYFSYGFQPADSTGWRSLPPSTDINTDNTWVTVPWPIQFDCPTEDAAAPVPTVGGWTFLYGPCHYVCQAEVRLDNETTEAQAHITLWETDATEAVLARRNCWEWMVGTKEGNTVHLDGAWYGWLAAGRKLRVQVDYWHATTPASIIAANVGGYYWRS